MNKKSKIVYNNTMQSKLIKKVDITEKASRIALDDLDKRIFDIIFAYSGSLDYGSLQIVETILLKHSKHLSMAKRQIAELYVRKDMENHPEMKQQVEQMMSKVTGKTTTPFSRN